MFEDHCKKLENQSDFELNYLSFSKTKGDTIDEIQQPSFSECGKSEDLGI